jgi:iron complex outermembrane receptor protein
MKVVVLVWVGLILAPAVANAQTLADLKRLTLQELMELEVSTVTRAPEAVARIPAAVFLITAEDIRRSGATSIPEVLRLAPGMQVTRIDSARWSIGMRGFADRLARAMLVLIDGRAVYSPLFAGTYWEVQDTLLEDVERIEIIRGPGGTLWGANAVTGIVNIVTKRANGTRGLLVKGGGGGPVDRAFAAVRWGGPVSRTTDYRVYVKGFSRGAQFRPGGAVASDEWSGGQAGFRLDRSQAGGGTFTIQGDLYRTDLGQRVALPSFEPPFVSTVERRAPLSGANVLARWARRRPDAVDLQLQVYYDYTKRDEWPIGEARHTANLDLQVIDRRLPRQSLAWGAGANVTSGLIAPVGLSAIEPPRRTDVTWSAFVQDELELVPSRLRAIAGVKFEHNAYSGIELQPSARLFWHIDDRHGMFAAVTRAVRTPSRVERDYTTHSLLNPAIPMFVRLVPNPAFQPEVLTAYELGYRVTPSERFYVTLDAFYNRHADTLSTEALTPFPETSAPGPPRLIVPVTFANGLHGRSYGVEIGAHVHLRAGWRLVAGYTNLQVEMTRDPGSQDVSQEARYERSVPGHQVQIQSSIDLRRLSLDGLVRYVTALRFGPVPAYATADVRVGWRLTPQLELALVGRDLVDSPHLEWPGAPVAIRRSGYVQVVVRR